MVVVKNIEKFALAYFLSNILRIAVSGGLGLGIKIITYRIHRVKVMQNTKR